MSRSPAGVWHYWKIDKLKISITLSVNWIYPQSITLSMKLKISTINHIVSVYWKYAQSITLSVNWIYPQSITLSMKLKICTINYIISVNCKYAQSITLSVNWIYLQSKTLSMKLKICTINHIISVNCIYTMNNEIYAPSNKLFLFLEMCISIIVLK